MRQLLLARLAPARAERVEHPLAGHVLEPEVLAAGGIRVELDEVVALLHLGMRRRDEQRDKIRILHVGLLVVGAERQRRREIAVGRAAGAARTGHVPRPRELLIVGARARDRVRGGPQLESDTAVHAPSRRRSERHLGRIAAGDHGLERGVADGVRRRRRPRPPRRCRRSVVVIAVGRARRIRRPDRERAPAEASLRRDAETARAPARSGPSLASAPSRWVPSRPASASTSRACVRPRPSASGVGSVRHAPRRRPYRRGSMSSPARSSGPVQTYAPRSRSRRRRRGAARARRAARPARCSAVSASISLTIDRVRRRLSASFGLAASPRAARRSRGRPLRAPPRVAVRAALPRLHRRARFDVRAEDLLQRVELVGAGLEERLHRAVAVVNDDAQRPGHDLEPIAPCTCSCCTISRTRSVMGQRLQRGSGHLRAGEMQLVREGVDLLGRRLVAAEDAEKDDHGGARASRVQSVGLGDRLREDHADVPVRERAHRVVHEARDHRAARRRAIERERRAVARAVEVRSAWCRPRLRACTSRSARRARPHRARRRTCRSRSTSRPFWNVDAAPTSVTPLAGHVGCGPLEPEPEPEPIGAPGFSETPASGPSPSSPPPPSGPVWITGTFPSVHAAIASPIPAARPPQSSRRLMATRPSALFIADKETPAPSRCLRSHTDTGYGIDAFESREVCKYFHSRTSTNLSSVRAMFRACALGIALGACTLSNESVPSPAASLDENVFRCNVEPILVQAVQLPRVSRQSRDTALRVYSPGKLRAMPAQRHRRIGARH